MLKSELENEIASGFRNFYKESTNLIRLNSAVKSIYDINGKKIELERLQRLIEDSIYLNAEYVQYIDGYNNSIFMDFCNNWTAWTNKCLTRSESRSMNMDYKLIVDLLFGKSRQFSVKLYNVTFLGYDKSSYMMYFTINNKYTVYIEIPNRKVCHNSSNVSKFNYFQCQVCATKEKYNKNTNYFKWEFSKNGFILNELVSEAIKFLDY